MGYVKGGLVGDVALPTYVQFSVTPAPVRLCSFVFNGHN